jgi:hypothetical protein
MKPKDNILTKTLMQGAAQSHISNKIKLEEILFFMKQQTLVMVKTMECMREDNCQLRLNAMRNKTKRIQWCWLG